MVTTALTWNSTINNVVAGGTPTAQYQDILFRLNSILITAGWGIPSMYSAGLNGGGPMVASAGNNFATQTDIVPGPDGGANTSYAMYEAPANFGANGGTLYFMWVAQDTPAPDRSVDFYGLVAPNSYSPSGTPLFNRMVASGGENSRLNINVRDATFVPHTWHAWWNNRGEILFGVSVDGTNVLETLIWIYSPDNAEGINDFGVFVAGSVVAGAPTWSPIISTPANHMCWFTDGSASVTEPSFVSIVQKATNWVNGLSNASTNPLTGAIDAAILSPSVGRYLGRIVDVRGVPDLLGPGTVDASDVDAQPNRMVSVGGLYIPTDKIQIAAGINL